MKMLKVIIGLCIFFAIAESFVVLHKPKPIKFKIPKGWAKPLYQFKQNKLTQEGFILGRTLFYDEILSKDSSISCASCHQQFAAFATSDHNLSHGYNNSFTTRNAPALQNLAWQPNFMADGSIFFLDEQPFHPITSFNEMNENLDTVLIKLQRSKKYRALFKNAFGNNLITAEKMNNALSQFLVMLVSSNSKYDKVMRKQDSFNLPQQLGYEIFLKKCNSCHTAPLFTNNSFINNDLTEDKYLHDKGRMRVTNDKNDSLKFRVPSLRNVMITMPYAHDGRWFSLYQVFEHYKNKLKLSNFEIAQLTAFLNTLTDTSFIKNEMFYPPNYVVKPTTHLH